MKSKYDIVVVGSGPAGAMAARYAALEGASVLLLEKDREVGVPVRCAEGVGETSLRMLVDEIKPTWICQRITGATLFSPSGKTVTLYSSDAGYVLNRKVFDYDLAQMAVMAGADLATKAYVCNLQRAGGRITGAHVQHWGKDIFVKADLIIGADGVESRVGRWAGLNTYISMNDMQPCVQVTAGPLTIPMDVCRFYFSRKRIPGGYAWVFPKGDGMANIGLGIAGKCSAECSARAYLWRFLQEFFPGVAIIACVAGGVPCAPTLKNITGDQIMLVGDAAHQANPLSGGGIINAMIAGKIAGLVAGRAIKEKNLSKKRLQEYAVLWDEAEGAKLRKFYKLKKFIFNLTDDDLDKLADAVLTIPDGERTILQILKVTLLAKPSLILDAIRVFDL
jgi:digeranylgeranylglycerophospholipid reductase